MFVERFRLRLNASFLHDIVERCGRDCRCSPNKEYGGYGMKGTASNRALNAAGDSGVQLVLKGEGIEGDRVLIGSQRATEPSAAIQSSIAKSGGAK